MKPIAAPRATFVATRSALARLRVSAVALAFAALGWASGCAGPRPLIEPVFEKRTYTPAKVALLPPAVFMVYDEYGDNDPRKSWELGQAASKQTVDLIAQELGKRGYAVDLSARPDGIYDGNGQLLVSGHDMAWLSSSIVQFANSEAGGEQGPMAAPAFVAPELARRVGWATQSDALLYVNMKGVAVSPGKRTAQVLGVVFFVVIVAAIIAMLVTQQKSGGKGSGLPGRSSGAGGTAVPGSGAGSGAAVGGQAMSGGPGAPTQAVVAPVGRGRYSGGRGGGRVYHGGPRVSTGVHVGIGYMVPIDSGEHVHPGPGQGPVQVQHEDEVFAGDQIWVSMTLVAAHDGRVLWHIRDSVDVEPDQPHELEAFVRRYMDLIPPALGPGAPSAEPAEPARPPSAP